MNNATNLLKKILEFCFDVSKGKEDNYLSKFLLLDTPPPSSLLTQIRTNTLVLTYFSDVRAHFADWVYLFANGQVSQ